MALILSLTLCFSYSLICISVLSSLLAVIYLIFWNIQDVVFGGGTEKLCAALEKLNC